MMMMMTMTSFAHTLLATAPHILIATGGFPTRRHLQRRLLRPPVRLSFCTHRASTNSLKSFGRQQPKRPDTSRWKWREYCTLLEPKPLFCFEVKLFFATDTTSQISRLFSPQCDTMSHSLNDVHFDTDYRFVVGRLMQELQQNGPRLYLHSEPVSLSKTSDGITITLKDGSTQGPFDQVRLNADRLL
jgi:hypothetical protein